VPVVDSVAGFATAVQQLSCIVHNCLNSSQLFIQASTYDSIYIYIHLGNLLKIFFVNAEPSYKTFNFPKVS
jgi:hypothetical protein